MKKIKHDKEVKQRKINEEAKNKIVLDVFGLPSSTEKTAAQQKIESEEKKLANKKQSKSCGQVNMKPQFRCVSQKQQQRMTMRERREHMFRDKIMEQYNSNENQGT